MPAYAGQRPRFRTIHYMTGIAMQAATKIANPDSTASKLAAHRKLIIALYCAIFLPLLPVWLAPKAGIAALPTWFASASAIGALACLFALLCVAWRSGAMRGGFVIAFAAALLALPAAHYLQRI